MKKWNCFNNLSHHPTFMDCAVKPLSLYALF
jgi:hypothetical protein